MIRLLVGGELGVDDVVGLGVAAGGRAALAAGGRATRARALVHGLTIAITSC